MLDQLETIQEQLLKPISEAHPCGEDPKYEDAYESLKQEIAKMGGMGAGSTDWEKVEKDSFDLLAGTAKEINLIAYLSVAWTRNRGLPGLIAAFECAEQLLAAFWEGMHPPIKRLKARAGAVSWLQERINEVEDKIDSNDRALLERALAAVKQLKVQVSERFEEPPAHFRKIRERLEDLLARAPEPESAAPPAPEPDAAEDAPAEPDAASSPPTAAPAQTSPAPAAPSAPRSPVEAPTLPEGADAEQLYEALGKIAAELRALAPANPSPYTLQRIALWDDASAPASNDAKETFFPAPPDDVHTSLKNMRAKAAWAPLLARAEDLTARWRFWLDLQCYAAQAARSLGYEDVSRVIERAAARLVERLPVLADLKFDDGSPFASPPTKEWLAGIRPEGEGGVQAESDAAASLREELAQLGANQFAEAMSAAQTAIIAAPNPREALRLRLAAAAFCLEGEQPHWADALLRAATADIEKRELHYWEPQLAAEAWRLTLETARVLKESEDGYAELERRAMHALAALDLSQAGRYPKAKSQFG